MKSYFLHAILDVAAAENGLDRLLPLQRRPWIMVNEAGDPVAYVDLRGLNTDYEGLGDPAGAGPMVQADISGRHYGDDEPVLAFLRQLQEIAGGLLMDDFDNVL